MTSSSTVMIIAMTTDLLCDKPSNPPPLQGVSVHVCSLFGYIILELTRCPLCHDEKRCKCINANLATRHARASLATHLSCSTIISHNAKSLSVPFSRIVGVYSPGSRQIARVLESSVLLWQGPPTSSSGWDVKAVGKGLRYR